MKYFLSLISLVVLLQSCFQNKKYEADFIKKTLLYQDDFSSNNSDDWITELQAESGNRVGVNKGALEIDVPKGVTVWFKHKLCGDILIEYQATVIDSGGTNDRVSDLNCFWMASDPRNADDLFDSPRKASGKFQDYDTLRLYYVGMGGHNNTKTRFRRYNGKGEKPLLPEHDLEGKTELISPNKSCQIQLVAMGSQVQFFRDGELVYDFIDESPYTQGWFGIRTIENHMKIDDFKVYRIEKKQIK
ncbi:Tat pathway signal sequence domain protein [Ancylomarina euxinus]|uniref:Tat pathway signal sequence domain protein n=1 Tax=Ancylomarina euxinus TaxID=2283627 RepID=A0A425XZH3_9BACT|nr:DUF6250 domain-containing protein [Ancylomarina euxinus]MCZ4694784.1 DUF6250 domain-containing protein [Ancylomarina euxinus]MUP15858.1 Tat pathway signal sequence domain protein [Ancylomarina euxinus]RRG20497.1 Tat pathway signal sequence domain protein [Ancylomarina euxinus]